MIYLRFVGFSVATEHDTEVCFGLIVPGVMFEVHSVSLTVYTVSV